MTSTTTQLLVQQKKGVRRAVDERAEALLAGAQFLLGMPPIGDVEHEAHHALRSAFGVEEHATFRPQPVDGAVPVNHPVLGIDIAGFVRTLGRELHRRPVVGMDELRPALVRFIERARLQAIHCLELRRPAVFALASADVHIECRCACRRLRKVEHFLSHAQLSFGALALGDVARDGDAQPAGSVSKLTTANLDRKNRSVFAPPLRLESHDVTRFNLLDDTAQSCLVETCIEGRRFHPYQLLTCVAEAFTRLPVHVDDCSILRMDHERVGRNVQEGAKALLARPQRVLGTPAPRTELAEQQAQRDEDEESERIVRRQFERIRRRDEPIQNSCCADQRSEQARSASAIPGTQDHCRDGKLIDGGALQQGK